MLLLSLLTGHADQEFGCCDWASERSERSRHEVCIRRPR